MFLREAEMGHLPPKQTMKPSPTRVREQASPVANRRAPLHAEPLTERRSQPLPFSRQFVIIVNGQLPVGR
jgi:hypothetical protein